MIIKINDQPETIDATIATVADLIRSRNIPTAGTAVAINAKLVRREVWEVTDLQERDNVMIISAAYGG